MKALLIKLKSDIVQDGPLFGFSINQHFFVPMAPPWSVQHSFSQCLRRRPLFPMADIWRMPIDTVGRRWESSQQSLSTKGIQSLGKYKG